jgi:hypothetical protein
VEISIATELLSRANKLDASSARKIWTAIERFQSDPDHPALNFHPVKSDPSGRLHTIRASDDLRVLVAREGGVHVVLDADHHDTLYERAERKRFIVNPNTGFIGLINLGGDEAAPSVETEFRRIERDDRPGVLDHWTDADLAEARFDADEIAMLRRCKTEDELGEADLDDTAMLLAIELLELTPEQWRTPSMDPTAEAEQRFRQAIVEHGALSGISPLFTAEEIEKIASAPIEEWMIFLHPDQRTVVTRRYEGPARVRGSAGTGKTVVALHRAAALANRFAGEEPESGYPILFTTFIKNLPRVLEHLYERLPDAVPGAVEFIHIDSLANRVCRDAGYVPPIDPNAIDSAWATAFNRVVKAGTPLALAGFTRGYLRAEVTAVIKGRGVRSADEYLGMERTGRGTRLTEPMRRQVWELRTEWDAEMERRGTIDFVDVVVRGRDHARRATAPRYRAAIVDEAQDLSLVGLQLVRALVNGPDGRDRPDGLLLVGDGAQRIYPGGFTLRQAGVEVRGRTTVLRRNYRNRPEIAAAAMAVAGDQPVEDLGEEYKRGEDAADSARPSGTLKPILVHCDGVEGESMYIAQRIRDLVSSGAITFGDVAVCASTNAQVGAVRERLESMKVPTQPLDKYDGTESNKVKVGTHFRVKGLEFKLVFLPRLGEDDFPRRRLPGQSVEEYDEEVGRAVSQLFVAMTRARDALVLLASGSPSSALAGGVEHFETVES